MKTKNDIKENPVSKEISLPKKKKERKILKFLLKHKVTVVLILIILAVIIWAKVTMHFMENDFLEEKNQIIKTYELQIDSINISKMELVTKVFSWAIRSEMTRENIEQVNQFFLDFIKVPIVMKIQLVNPDNSSILISTDKKDEDQMISDTELIQTDTLSTYKMDSVNVKIVAPIMGLNRKVGILIIDLKNR